MKQIWTIILLLSCILMYSCKSSTSVDSTASNIARLTSFYFAKNDSFPGLSAAKFTIKELLDTGLVYNEDSIRFGTSIRRVVPKFSFYSTPFDASLHMIDAARGLDTTFSLAYSDTLNFNCEYIYLRVVSRDQSKVKVYRIETRVHQVDPNLYAWQTLSEQVHPAAGETQQMLELKDKLLIYANDGLSTRLYTSTDMGNTWSAGTTISSLPTDCRVRSIVALRDSLYYVQDTDLYTSGDGVNWSQNDCSSLVSTFHSVLLAWVDTVWVVGERADESLGLYKVEGNSVVDRDIDLDDQFPVSGFAATAFTSTSDRARAMVFGGMSRDGAYLNARWNLEYSLSHKLLRMTNYAKEQPASPCLAGASLVWYKNRLHLFGGVDKDGKVMYSDAMYVSDDEGMHWTTLDTAQCHLPAGLTPRYNTSMLVGKDRAIYIYGGQSRTGTYTDLYRTKLQSIDWKN